MSVPRVRLNKVRKEGQTFVEYLPRDSVLSPVLARFQLSRDAH
jgi:hypothetical protein